MSSAPCTFSGTTNLIWQVSNKAPLAPWRLAGCLSFLPVHCAFAQAAQKYTFW